MYNITCPTGELLLLSCFPICSKYIAPSSTLQDSLQIQLSLCNRRYWLQMTNNKKHYEQNVDFDQIWWNTSANRWLKDEIWWPKLPAGLGEIPWPSLLKVSPHLESLGDSSWRSQNSFPKKNGHSEQSPWWYHRIIEAPLRWVNKIYSLFIMLYDPYYITAILRSPSRYMDWISSHHWNFSLVMGLI